MSNLSLAKQLVCSANFMAGPEDKYAKQLIRVINLFYVFKVYFYDNRYILKATQK